jgi:hypothetical protein
MTSPQEIDRLDPHGFNGIATAVSGEYLYINWSHIQNTPQITIYDISTPTNPVSHGSLKSRSASRLDARGASVAGAFGIRDVLFYMFENPDQPLLQAYYEVPRDTFTHDVALDESRAVVAFAQPSAQFEIVHGFHVLDMTNPSVPKLQTAFYLSGAVSSVELDGNLVFVSVGGVGFYVVDISSETHPEIVGHFFYSGGANDLALDGEYIYAVGDTSGLRIFQTVGIEQTGVSNWKRQE